MSEQARTIVLYDRDCGFCRWALDKVLLWDRHGRLRPVEIQSEEGDALLDRAGVPDAARLESWHLALPSGELRSAGAGAAPLAEQLPGGRPLAAMFRRFPGTHRTRIPLGRGQPRPACPPSADRRDLRDSPQRRVGAANQPPGGMMQITRNSLETGRGPSDWFTGEVYFDTVAVPEETSRARARSASASRPARGPPGTPIRTARRSSSPRGSAAASAAAARSRRSGRATASSSSPARSIGTGRRRTGS